MKHADRYSQGQLVAHWIVAFLVVFQFLFNGSMQRAFEQSVEAGIWQATGGAVSHGLSGAIIFCLMAWRLSMRLRHGTPPPPETEPRALQFVSRGTHWAFYALLLSMPVAGFLAIATLSPTLGKLHGLAGRALFVLALLHVAGALWHGLVKRDGVARRILRPTPPA
jgi:cytochrome b561